ncbi:predicted protein [Naegleria gruberi]|uniref:Predicted protein n=1 Tax=Naegleria gruberi TaxID=5762 RepID=D2VSR6_NAEGR|nr:uncharacterized protein NAEGRDRAFT_72035 [Naegleria gruberi]EFC40241.1 predicted protein [Naegleria gruberi]|eukprot:XP_002672985.1 predicted protein [Naegleria gruberi strain NEG-M]
MVMTQSFSLRFIAREIPQQFLDDKEIAMAAIKKNPKNVELISDRLQNDENFFLESVKANIFSYREFPEPIREKRENVLKLVHNNAPLFIFPNNFRMDTEIVQICIGKRCSDLGCVHKSILTKEFLLLLIQKTNYVSYDIFSFIPDHLITDTDIAKAVFQRNGISYCFMNNMFKTREITEQYLSLDINNNILNYLPHNLLEDRDLVIRCLKNGVVYSLPNMYKNDKEIVMLGIGLSYKDPSHNHHVNLDTFIGEKLRRDNKFMLEIREKFPDISSI